MGWDGIRRVQFGSVRFDSLHFTDTPFSDDDNNNIMMMTKMMHSSCWLAPRTFSFAFRVVQQRGDDERGEGSEKASSADRWTDRQTGIAFTRSGLSSRCYAGDDSSSLLGGRFSM